MSRRRLGLTRGSKQAARTVRDCHSLTYLVYWGPAVKECQFRAQTQLSILCSLTSCSLLFFSAQNSSVCRAFIFSRLFDWLGKNYLVVYRIGVVRQNVFLLPLKNAAPGEINVISNNVYVLSESHTTDRPGTWYGIVSLGLYIIALGLGIDWRDQDNSTVESSIHYAGFPRYSVVTIVWACLLHSLPTTIRGEDRSGLTAKDLPSSILRKAPVSPSVVPLSLTRFSFCEVFRCMGRRLVGRR